MGLQAAANSSNFTCRGRTLQLPHAEASLA